jgi:hypothetical protein
MEQNLLVIPSVLCPSKNKIKKCLGNVSGHSLFNSIDFGWEIEPKGLFDKTIPCKVILLGGY